MTVTVDILRVNGKRMTTTLFRQLYEEKPFNQEFNLLYELKGKVLQKTEFVIFDTPKGLRKFNISQYQQKQQAQSLESNLFCSLHDQLIASELGPIRFKIYSYYSELISNTTNEDERDVLYPLICGKVGLSKHERENYYSWLIGSLKGDFKADVLREYEQAKQRIDRRNQLVEIFENTQQIFI